MDSRRKESDSAPRGASVRVVVRDARVDESYDGQDDGRNVVDAEGADPCACRSHEAHQQADTQIESALAPLQREELEVSVDPTVELRDRFRLVLDLDGQHDQTKDHSVDRANKVDESATQDQRKDAAPYASEDEKGARKERKNLEQHSRLRRRGLREGRPEVAKHCHGLMSIVSHSASQLRS